MRQLVLDREHLARYTLGDAALEAEVLELFINQLPETLAMLRASGDGADWKRAAHTIKGSARAVGAWQLAEAAQYAEKGMAEPERFAELADLVAVEIDRVRRAIAVGQAPGRRDAGVRAAAQ